MSCNVKLYNTALSRSQAVVKRQDEPERLSIQQRNKLNCREALSNRGMNINNV